MQNYHKILKKLISGYNGKHSEAIKSVPDIYNLLCNLVDNSDIEPSDRTEILSVIGYFVYPNDVMNEDILGPIGFIDDLLISLHIINKIKNKYDFETLNEEWNSKVSLSKLLEETFPILVKEYKYEFNKKKYFIID